LRVINRFTEGKAQRNASGKITKAATYQSKDIPNARVEPHRKWFTNSRVISQSTLTAFRDAVEKQSSDPNSFLLKSNKLPMSLIRDDKTERKNGIKQHKAKMVIESTSFKDTFGPKAQRKRVKLSIDSFNDMAGESAKMHDTYLDKLDELHLLSGQSGPAQEQSETHESLDHGTIAAPRESIFSKGQSKRIWNELYKVLDSSDVIVHVLDARDPVGTRCRVVETYLKTEAPHKHLCFVLNKCDLVPTAVAVSSILFFPPLPHRKHISPSFPIVSQGLLPFHESVLLQLWEINFKFNYMTTVLAIIRTCCVSLRVKVIRFPMVNLLVTFQTYQLPIISCVSISNRYY
jgi:nuclear GTP-binding protein